MQIDVDIFGACTIRDAFEFSPILKSKYQVKKFIQNNSLLTLDGGTLKSLGISIEREHFKNSPPCWYKWFDVNANDKVFTYLADNSSNFLIINLTETYYTFYEILDTYPKVRICNQFGLIVNKILDLLPKYKAINPLDLSFNEVNLLVQSFHDKLLNIYSEDRIILIKNYPARYYITDSDSFFYEYKVEFYDKINAFLSKVYKAFIDCFDCIKIVDLPSNSLGYDKHKWGLNNQHYILDVYYFLGECIDYAIENTINDVSSYVVNHCLYLRSLDFYNYINDKFANYKVYKSPYIDFCMRYSFLRVLIISPGEFDKVFEVKNISPKSSIYSPKWVKTGYSMMLLSNYGNLHFDVTSKKELILKIYLQSIDSRSMVENTRYEINIILTSLTINNEICVSPSKKIVISHDKPYVIDYRVKPLLTYAVNIQHAPDKYF